MKTEEAAFGEEDGLFHVDLSEAGRTDKLTDCRN